MQLHKKGIILLCVILSFFQPVCEASERPVSVTLSIMEDGYTEIEYIIPLDTSHVTANLTLLGGSYESVVIYDEKGVELPWEPIQNGIRVTYNGSNLITIFYRTNSLTSKDGSTWTLKSDAPAPVIVYVPFALVLTELNPSPLSIVVIEGRPTLVMPEGVFSISYTTGPTGSAIYARLFLNEAETTIQNLIDKGIVVRDAEAKLGLARNAFENSFYMQCEQLSREAVEIAKRIEDEASGAQSHIEYASLILDERAQGGRTAPVIRAEEELQEALTAYENGDYLLAKSLAENVKEIILTEPDLNLLEEYGVLFIFITIAALTAVYLYTRIKRVTRERAPEKMKNFDEYIYEYPEIRQDDIKVLRFLYDRNGAYITEIRDKFDIPKSSAWRMLRRLENLGVIVRSVKGRETFVNIQKKDDEN